MTESPFKKHLQVILNRMCNIVGADYKTIDFKSDDWFMKYSWTEEQQEEYLQWLIKYFKTKPRIAKLFFPSDIERGCNYFIMMYGWRLK